MKITANDYEPREIMKIIREWTELTQEQFGKSINRSKMSVQAFELGKRNYTMPALLDIAEKHGLTITIEKNEYCYITTKTPDPQSGVFCRNGA